MAREISLKTEICKSAAPLIRFLQHLQAATKKLFYIICFDNLFTSTGTMREKWIGRIYPVPDSESCKKKPRGYIASAKNIDDDSILVQWKDSNVVTMASTVHVVQPVSTI